MRIILTHEQADFDAVASLLAAHCIDPLSVPVLPRRLNRNVRAFLTLYGSEMAFEEAAEMGSHPIDTVTLVDTQSIVSIRGITPSTQVRVIDHHPRRENLPSEWDTWIDEIGSTTTLLTEVLQEENGEISAIQATLLLLGIYEDTGSLTYTRTSYRDVRAASYLLEAGASLEILNDFLNHPLTPEQQEIYEQLRANIETLKVHGYTILVASADAHQTEEELSTIAHKLRDLYDPAALFVLVQTRAGVQMIARSTTDHIDVANILSQFGGGGHERAAAGLVRNRDMGEIRASLVNLLPGIIKPAITVAQIMSTTPQLLDPETSAEDAARRMQYYGYEGYPVVREGKVIGLLTRRAVDRSQSHRLNLTAAQLMEAGEVTVYPDDSIEVLQEKMIASGWGQIPVINPENGQVIGIVTRTDLLKTLTRQSHPSTRENVAQKLEAALPPTRLALLRAVTETASHHGIAIYVVGGFVRDLLLERPSLDFDLVVEGDAIRLAKNLAKVYGGRVTSHARFGTAKWHTGEIRHELVGQLMKYYTNRMDSDTVQSAPQIVLTNQADLPDSLDLVSARTEFYAHPSALPTVERGSIKLDLHRRDFTINTLAIRLDGGHFGELYDFWGGLNDLRHELVRVLHSLSFVDDPTRMLRAVRFEQRFCFHIENRTLELLNQALPLLERVSGDRIRHELNQILIEPNVYQMMERLTALNLLANIDPALSWDGWLEERYGDIQISAPEETWEILDPAKYNDSRLDLSYILWLIRLNEIDSRRVMSRLKLPVRLCRIILQAHQLILGLPALINKPDSERTYFLDEFSPYSRYGAYLAASDEEEKQILLEYATRWSKVQSRINGHALRSRGVPPGPHYRAILLKLRAAWLDGIITNEQQENELLEKLIIAVSGKN